MSEGIKNEIRNAMHEDRMYDWVCQNYHRLSNDELATLLKEYIYVTNKNKEKEVLENLEDREWC